MRRLLSTTLLVAALPSLGAAQSAPPPPAPTPAPTLPSLLGTLLDVDVIAQRIAQAGIMGLRTQLDLVYGGLSVDVFTGKITMTDLRAWPLPDWDAEGICEISVDRVTLRSGAIDQPDRLRGKAQLIGAAFPSACLPPDLQQPLGMIGATDIEIPRLTIEFDYGLPSSDLLVRIHGDLTDLATVDAQAYMTYFWFDGRDDIEDPIPVVFLEHAALSLENKGLWQKVAPLLPPPLTGEGAGLFLEGALGETLLSENRYALDDENATLSPGQQGLVTSLKESWPAFVADPQKIVLETSNDADVFLDFELIDDDPREIFDALLPVVRLSSGSAPDLLPAALLSAVSGGTASPDETRRVGLAMLSGEGVPRNILGGTALLRPLVQGGDGEAAAAIARATEQMQPRDAYAAALVGGQSGIVGMAGLMDRLEKKIGLPTALALQAETAGGTAAAAPDQALTSVAAIRDEAAMRFSGKGRPRSYEGAAEWAMIGAAAGDAEAADILAEIEERMRLGGDAALAAWREAESRAATKAATVWIERDLPSILAQ